MNNTAKAQQEIIDREIERELNTAVERYYKWQRQQEVMRVVILLLCLASMFLSGMYWGIRATEWVTKPTAQIVSTQPIRAEMVASNESSQLLQNASHADGYQLQPASSVSQWGSGE